MAMLRLLSHFLLLSLVLLAIGCGGGAKTPEAGGKPTVEASTQASSETTKATPKDSQALGSEPPRLEIAVTAEVPTIPNETQPLGTILSIKPQLERKMKLLRLVFSHESGATMGVNLSDRPVNFPIPAVSIGQSTTSGDTKWKVKAEGWEPGEGDAYGPYRFFWASELWVAPAKAAVTRLPIDTDSRYSTKTALVVSRRSLLPGHGFAISPEMHFGLKDAAESIRFVFQLPPGIHGLSRWSDGKHFKWTVGIRAD